MKYTTDIKTPKFDENGFATSNGWVMVYRRFSENHSQNQIKQCSTTSSKNYQHLQFIILKFQQLLFTPSDEGIVEMDLLLISHVS
ncbi:hypothetical protein KKJ17_18370 [Xenorhabdus bovienii]|uniref:hypothetical protein n=1 Tax=Xenorhabdus bovienii TaxID=40576 RepID=UPI0023B2344F|nr:hypothetical protein [Xenorhabdus bovienii]MDE9519631.1 hypothetical protein [Xenorhabdus bovienii]